MYLIPIVHLLYKIYNGLFKEIKMIHTITKRLFWAKDILEALLFVNK